MLFTYPSISFPYAPRTSVISRELAERLADVPGILGHASWPRGEMLRKAGADRYEHHWNLRGPRHAHVPPPKARHYDPVAFALTDGLPDFWSLDVWAVLSERAAAKHKESLAASIAAVANRPIRERLMAMLLAGREHMVKAERRDLSELRPVRSFTAKGGCTARMKLGQAVIYAYEQASYADHSRYLIPVEGEVGDLGVCQSNLHAWCEAIRSHNGMAGSGCTYSALLVVTPDGAYVELDCRASISD